LAAGNLLSTRNEDKAFIVLLYLIIDGASVSIPHSTYLLATANVALVAQMTHQFLAHNLGRQAIKCIFKSHPHMRAVVEVGGVGRQRRDMRHTLGRMKERERR